MKKRDLLVVIACLTLLFVVGNLFFFALNWLTAPLKVNQVDDAALCQENGDIAIEFSLGREIMEESILVFDREGNELFSTDIYSAGGAVALCWKDNNLFAYVFRTDKLYEFNRNGERLSETAFSHDDWHENYTLGEWSGWNSSGKKKNVQWNDYNYEYTLPTLKDLTATLIITHDDQQKTIFFAEYKR